MKTLTEFLALVGIGAILFASVAAYHRVQVLTPSDITEICNSLNNINDEIVNVPSINKE